MGLHSLPAGAVGNWGTPPSTEAFQANNGYLYTNMTGGSALNTVQGMQAGTSPAVAALTGGGYEVAFQANNGYLYLFNTKTGKTVNTAQGMAANTSPAVAALTGGGYEVAFQANNGYLYTFSSTSGPAASTLGMAPSSNPSITRLPDNNYVIAFSASGSSDLYFYSTAIIWSQAGEHPAGLITTDQGIESGTSPSITTIGSGFEAAFNASGLNKLYLYYSGTGVGGTLVDLEPNTSPSISEVDGPIYMVAYAVPGSDNLGVLSGVGSRTIVTDQGLAPGTSPSIIGLGSEYQVAFQAAGSNHLIVYEPASAVGYDTGQGMALTTSPTIE